MSCLDSFSLGIVGRRLTWKQLTQQTVELYQKVKMSAWKITGLITFGLAGLLATGLFLIEYQSERRDEHGRLAFEQLAAEILANFEANLRSKTKREKEEFIRAKENLDHYMGKSEEEKRRIWKLYRAKLQNK
ncbi:MAG: hypothetical protein M2R45_04372 [Verrucomicrobia subdivision 3 bacterium]|nr:hypothetical protein [Limisphaerales bacterium]MCS1416077.1 hypothetical protein [Limisphaerales bacterium]